MDFNSFKKKGKSEFTSFFSVKNNKVFTHIKFNIFPDGGVARLRLYGSIAKSKKLKNKKINLASLLDGASVKIGEIIDLEDKDQKKGAIGVIKKAIENFEDYGIEVLRLISGFVSWESDVNNPYAPLITYSISIENPSQSLKNIEISLTDVVPEINTALVLHLNKKSSALYQKNNGNV